MAKQKMEWLKDYKGLTLGMYPKPDPTGLKQTAEYESNDKVVEYKKRQVINVEKRDRTLFHDLDNNLLFRVDDPSAYRLF